MQRGSSEPSVGSIRLKGGAAKCREGSPRAIKSSRTGAKPFTSKSAASVRRLKTGHRRIERLEGGVGSLIKLLLEPIRSAPES